MKPTFSRRRFVKTGVLSSVAWGAGITRTAEAGNRPASVPAAEADPFRIAVFDMDATPPIGSQLTYGPMINSWDLSLRARGIVLAGAGKPIVLCAIDWIGIANESLAVFKGALAAAADTTPERVTVHTLHQHDAPICDFEAERVMQQLGVSPHCFESYFARTFLDKLARRVKESLGHMQPVTHIGVGKAPVYQVASNRRIVKNGRVGEMRATACKNAALRAEPEGLIDPDVTLLSFWNKQAPIAVLTFYATHPQSYYLTGIANPDFPGMARSFRQMAVPDALHVHFNGAGGNIGAGKYNDGAHENRLILAQRLADGMERAWNARRLFPVSGADLTWNVVPVHLPVSESFVKEVESRFKSPTGPYFYANNVSQVIWAKKQMAGATTDIACLGVGQARVLFMFGELFVEYQLAAKALRPDLAVSMAAYGEYGPLYIGTGEAYGQGGYEIGASPVTAEAESVLMAAMTQLLKG
ncbi:MAG: hypothetical protein LBP50_08915 [Tannerella sp.]|jgi:hypothetical protein|nr:hypothetical protein [Tannerella sp.]